MDLGRQVKLNRRNQKMLAEEALELHEFLDVRLVPVYGEEGAYILPLVDRVVAALKDDDDRMRARRARKNGSAKFVV